MPLVESVLAPQPQEFIDLLERYNSDEITDDERLEIEAQLQEFCEFKDFITHLCNYAIDKEADEAYFTPQYKRLKARIDKAKASAARTWNFVDKLLKNRKIDKMRAGEIDLSFRKSMETIIVDPALLPDELCKITREGKKTEIKAAINEGKVITGAYLKEKQNLQVK